MSSVAESGVGRHRSGGFTLIEVLAALVIVALGMLGVIQAVAQTARNGTYLREKTLAHWIAMNVITERRLMDAPPEISETSDEVEFAGQRWRWTLTVTQTQVDSLRRMDVSVRPASAPEGRSLATLTGFYGTAISHTGGGLMVWAGTPGGSANDGADDGSGSATGTGGQDGSGGGQTSETNPAGGSDKSPKQDPDEE
jgi:general secretion pathway protein I